ncbi:FxSxx-COOH system tetratricopeptide repeat protein [Streptomyces sp. NPDC004327]|uniref:FxSxx-COOH system tetratricopeptide repeat protein n=1 Tax=Streptomyces sp. NPDC004327 TaxID=3364699 RepID=UPI0036980B37
MALPDPGASRAVLIGIDEYRDLPSLRPVGRGRDRLAELLRDPAVWGLHEDRVTVFGAEAGRDEILAAVKEAAKAATDTLLLYFAGHGLRDRAGQQLHLALTGADDEHPQIGSIVYDDIRRTLKAGHRAKRRIVLLDCCYSGLAGSMGPQGITRAELSEQAAIEGTYLLTSASSTQRAFAHDDQPYPEFTGVLIDILESGLPAAGPELTLNTIWQASRSALLERGSPEPQQFGQNATGDLAWVTNAAYGRPDAAWSRALLRRVAELREALGATERRLARVERRCGELQEEVALLRERREQAETRSAPGAGDIADMEQAEAAGGDDVRHFTVVHPGYHQSWAAWIAQRLEAHGCRVTQRRWDQVRGVPREDYFKDLLLTRGRILLVLGDWFADQGPRQAGEWNDVLRGFVAAHAERFAAVSLTNRTLPSAATILEPVDLWGVGEEEAEARLLSGLGIARRRRSPLGSLARVSVRHPDTPPGIWGEVPRRDPRFTGRDGLLSELRTRLTDAERGGGACTLLGMSGIGRTAIASEYAHRFSSDYDVVWWVDSGDRNVLRDRFGELAAQLGLTTGNEPGERIRAVREALGRGDPYSRWLVVFDGWDDTDGAHTFLPRGPGHVLVTSRNRGWRDHTDVLDVPGFDRAESTAYLMRRAPHITASEADEVAAEFGDVPLPLVQAAAWLGESRMEVPEYLRMVQEKRLSLFGGPAAVAGVPHDSYANWSILLAELRRSQPQAFDVLNLAVAFGPGRIPLGMVREHPVDLPKEQRWMIGDQPAWNRALDTLVDHSLLTRETRGLVTYADTVHMHRHVHDIVAELTDGPHRDTYRKAVRSLLPWADPGNPLDSRNWPRYAELLPHLEPSGALTSGSRGVQNTVLNCLRYSVHSGAYRTGIRLAGQIRAEWSEFMDPLSQQMVDLTLHESSLVRAEGRVYDAQRLNLGLRERLGGATPANELGNMLCDGALASDLRHLGEYQEAGNLQHRALIEAQRLLGDTDVATLAARNDLGRGMRLLGGYEDAYEHDTATLARGERALLPPTVTTLGTGLAVAEDLRLLGRYREALARQESTLRMHEQVLGSLHPQTLEARVQLIRCRRRGGALQPDLGATMAGLLEQLEQVHGRGHHATLSFLNDYGNFLRAQGDVDKARELVDEAEAGYRDLLGPAHPVATGMLISTALAMEAAGEGAGALDLLEAALIGLAESVGPDHPWTLCCALATSGARAAIGRLDEDAELGRNTLLRAENTLGDEHPFTLACRVALAVDLRALRLTGEAGVLEGEAVHSLTRTLGARHPQTVSARQRVRPTWDFEAPVL